MKNLNGTKVLGILPMSFGEVCKNYNFLIAEEARFLEHINPEDWYPLEKVLKIFNFINENYSDPSPIFEQIGIEMMKLWYNKGAGKQIIKKGVDFLHFQTSSEGYYSIIHGEPDQIGDFKLLSLDEEKGEAAVRSTTCFNRDMEKGILIGGMSCTKDLIYINIDNSDDENTFHIQFQNSDSIKRYRKIAHDIPEEVGLATLYWKHRMLEDEFKRHTYYWNSTNETLTNAFTKLGNQDEELRVRTAELLQTNKKLKDEILKHMETEETLSKTLQRQSLLVEQSPLAVIEWSTEFKVVSWNPAAEKMFGFKESEAIGKHASELVVSSDYKTYVDNIWQELLNHKGGRRSVNPNITKDGKNIICDWFNSPITDSDGHILGIASMVMDITEREQTENALRDSEAELRALFEGMPDVVIMLDKEGRYRKIAPTSPELLFKPEAELKGKSLHETFPPDQADLFLEHIQQSLLKQKLVKFEYSLDIAGSELWFDGRISPMSEKTVIFVARDITARKRAEETLRESEEKHRVIFENATEIIMIAQDGKIAFANPAFKKILGYSDNEIISKSFDNFIHPDDREMVLSRYKKRMSGENVETGYQFRALTALGEEKWVIINSCALDWDGKPSTLNFLTDITPRKRAEEVLRESKAKLRSILDSSPDGIGVSDLNGEIIDCNQSMLEIHGYKNKEEVIGKSPLIFVAEKDHEKAVKNLEKALSVGIINNLEYTFIKKNGNEFPVELSLSPIQDSSGSPTGFVAIARDITKRKKNEIALRNAKETAEDAQQESEAANKAKTTFLANMSHELRTPLNSILGYTQILKRDKTLQTKQVDAIDTIHSSGEHLLNLINELLDLSRIEAEQMNLEISEVSLSSFLKGIADISEMRAQQEGVSINFEIASDLPRGVRVDEKRLRQVLLNLINNAIKFAESGDVVVRVNSEPIDSKDDLSSVRLHCEVEDTGIGIAENEIDEIFLPFHQLNKSKVTTEGSGLGLPISRNLLNIMGSELKVNSNVGKGTKFWFDLDLHTAENIFDNDEVVEEKHSPQIIAYKGSTHKVLLVDDNKKNRSLLRDILLPIGFEIQEAVNGKDAIEKSKTFHPELIIMDLVMPIMDGIEATKEIRKIPSLEKVVVIGISASAIKGKKQMAFKRDCNDFIAKPIHIVELLDCIKRQLGIEWVYEEETESKIKKDDGDELVPFIIPPREDLGILLKYAQTGHVTGLQNILEEIKRKDKQYIPFVNKIEGLAENFQFKQIDEIIQSYLHRE